MATSDSPVHLLRFHQWFGWSTLLLFLSMGMVLESLHAFKVDWYLDVGLENRRLMWTLAHSHGALLGLIHLALAAHVERMAWGMPLRAASATLAAATILLPGGFLLGGAFLQGSDPGIGVLLTPLGGLALVVSIACALVATLKSSA
jgi:hypothetical protein